jgi:hypothetical protein
MLEFRVTLRIFSNKINLKDISEQLQCKPCYGFSIGDKYARNRRTREQSLWTIESKLPSEDKLESHILEILDFVYEKQTVIAKLKLDCSMDLFCYLGTENGQGGAELSAELCGKISKWDLNITLDVHATSESE